MKVFILLSIVSVALASRECGDNEHFDFCGSACPLTCDNYENPPRFCILRCDSGCHCNVGFVKNDEGRCVRPEECPAKAEQVCGENQRFLECGTPCPLTCDNFANPPKICPAMCVSGCHCEVGYVKTRTGACVRPENCPSNARRVCGENQRFLECGSACPLTCENFANPPKICPAMCVTGCHCEGGYVKTSSGACVRPENCPGSARPVEKNCVDMPESGMCMAYFPSWYFDVKLGKCQEFIYGGCQGNGNRYETEKECLAHCEATKSAPTACLEGKVIGPCKAAFVRFYFDKDSGKCVKFTYGGCQGNSNNFHSQEECEAVCIAEEE